MLVVKKEKFEFEIFFLLFRLCGGSFAALDNTAGKCKCRLPYPLDCNPRVLFFKMGFWVGVNSKNPSKSGLFDQKVGVYSRKTTKTGLFNFLGLYSRVGLQSSGYGMLTL